MTLSPPARWRRASHGRHPQDTRGHLVIGPIVGTTPPPGGVSSRLPFVERGATQAGRMRFEVTIDSGKNRWDDAGEGVAEAAVWERECSSSGRRETRQGTTRPVGPGAR